MRLESVRFSPQSTTSAITIDEITSQPPVSPSFDREEPAPFSLPRLTLKTRKKKDEPPIDVERRIESTPTTALQIVTSDPTVPGPLGEYAPGFKKLTTSVVKELGLDSPENHPRFEKLLDRELSTLKLKDSSLRRDRQPPVMLNEVLPDKKLLGDLSLKLKTDGVVAFVDIGNIDHTKTPLRFDPSFGPSPRTRLLQDASRIPLRDLAPYESPRDRLLRQKNESGRTPGFWSKLGAFALGSAVNFVSDYFLFNALKYDDPSKHDGRPVSNGYRVFQYSLQAYTSGWLAKNYGVSTGMAMMFSQLNGVNDFGYYGVGTLLDKAGLLGKGSKWDGAGWTKGVFDDAHPPSWFNWTPLALQDANFKNPNVTYGSQLVVQAVNSVPITIGMLRVQDRPLKDTKLADSFWGLWMKGVPTWQPF